MDTTTTAITTDTAAASAGRSFAQQTPGEQLFTLAVFSLGTLVSVAFAYYLFTDPSRLTSVWMWTRSLPRIVQAVIWLLALPWMVALWIWTLPWAAPMRIVLVVATLLFTVWLLFPWK